MGNKIKVFFILFLLIINLNVVKANEDIVVLSGDLSSCTEVLGANLTVIVKEGIIVIQIVCAIIAIVKGMIMLIPPILEKDADTLKKVSKSLINMAIVLVAIFLIGPLLKFIGNLVGFDTSCII